MNTNIELKNHLLFEFKSHKAYPQYLLETRGIFNEIDEITDIFLKMAMPQIKKVFLKNEKIKTFVYNQKSVDLSNVNSFFNQFKLTLTLTFGLENTYYGNTDANKSIIKDKKNNFICFPHIDLHITANSITKAIELLSFCIGHELTHCYNLLQYAKKNNYYNSIDILNKMKYQRFQQAMNSYNNNYKAIGHVLYNLNRLERNAYIAQLRQELILKKDSLTDANAIFNTIKSTESYKKFLFLEKNINIILSDTLENETKKELIIYLNDIMETNFSTFNQLKKYFLRRWNKWKKSYLINASKIAYDIFNKNNLYLDGINMAENPIINNK